MEISRVWDRRATAKGTEAGRAGAVTIRVPDGPWYITDSSGQFQPIPANIVPVLLEQSLSPLTDSLTGTHKIEEAQAAFAAKLANLIAGKYNVRGGGGVDPLVAEMRRLVSISFETQKPDEWAGIKDADDLPERLDAIIAKQKGDRAEKLRATAQANLDKREAERLARAAKKAADAEAASAIRL